LQRFGPHKFIDCVKTESELLAKRTLVNLYKKADADVFLEDYKQLKTEVKNFNYACD